MSDKDWSRVASKWEEDDEPDELEGEGDEAWRQAQKRKKENLEVPPTAEEMKCVIVVPPRRCCTRALYTLRMTTDPFAPAS